VILDELVLTDFGSFGGRQSLPLTPAPGKPVVVVGALNGTGKTTVLEALQLALFGPLAPPGSRRGLGYEAYLAAAVHRGADPAAGAAVELSFRAHAEGQMRTFRVVRSWWLTPAGRVRENVAVHRDGEADPVMSEAWAEHVEAFVPRGVAGLFFFDGEQIESFADLQSSRELVETAVGGLLGLDLVDRLVADLDVLERRKRAEAVSGTDDEQHLAGLAKMGEALRIKEAERGHDLDLAKARVEKAAARAAAAEERYARDGGELHDTRAAIEAKAAAARNDAAVAAARLADAAGGIAPALLVPGLVRAAASQARAEQDQEDNLLMADLLGDRDSALLALLRDLGRDGRRAAEAAAAFMNDDLARRKRTDTPVVLGLGRDDARAVEQLDAGGLDREKDELAALLTAHEKALAKADRAERQLAAVPSPDALAHAALERDRARDELRRAQGELDAAAAAYAAATAARERNAQQHAAALAQAASGRLEAEDGARLLRHAEKARTTLRALRKAATARHAAQIQQHVLEAATQLLRKDRLLADVLIDPVTHAITLLDADGREVAPGRLSAGERQLLGVSLLWGLARAAGRPLPVVIDTPLGRLDGPHRGRILDAYLPQASHQVVVLSTDTEVDEAALARLGSAVSHTLHLVHDEATGSTRVDAGYFRDTAVEEATA
jgi:DNA sulfur modification protein DndD